MCYQLMSYRTEHGMKTVIVGPKGRKLMPILMMESSGLTVRKVPLTEQRYLTDAIQSGKSKSIRSVASKFRAYGRRTGMTKAAKSFLTAVNKAA